MKRRTTLAALPVLAAPSVAAAQARIRWRCVSSYPRSLDTVFGATEIVARTVAEATGGRFEIQVFPAGEIVPAFGVMEAVQNGTVECGHTASFFYWGIEPALAFDYTMPFGLNSRQHNAWYLFGGGRELIQAILGEYNIIATPCGNFGAQAGGWFRREIRSVADFRGLKMRIGGFSGAVFARIGGVPQNIPAGDIYPALERGTIDAAEWVGPHDDERLGFVRVAPHYYFPGWQEGSGQISFYTNRRALEALPADYRAILDAACAKAHLMTQARYDHFNPLALRRLVAQGAQLRFFNREILTALFRASNEVMDEQAARSPNFRRVMDNYRPYQREIAQWFQVAESQFDGMVAQLLRGGT